MEAFYATRRLDSDLLKSEITSKNDWDDLLDSMSSISTDMHKTYNYCSTQCKTVFLIIKHYEVLMKRDVGPFLLPPLQKTSSLH